MSAYTYESERVCTRLETYEWDNVWWEEAERSDLARILYIGDSISCGTRREATACSRGRMLFDGFGTSKAVDNPHLMPAIELFAAQQVRRDALLFNSGLHGWHLDDEEQYPHHYERLVSALLARFPDTPLFLLLTTSVADPEREQRVRRRNDAVRRIAEEYRLPVIDLYRVSVEHSALRTGDGVHFTLQGYQEFAREIVRVLERDGRGEECDTPKA